MKITLESTAVIDTIRGEIEARIWEGVTDTGIPVKAWIAAVQPQTHDETALAEFGRALKEMPMTRQLSTFDLRFVI